MRQQVLVHDLKVTQVCAWENADISFPGISSGGGGGCRCARGKIPGIPSGGEEEGLAPFGAGVSVGKFLEVTWNGVRVSVRIDNVINIYLARDNNKF